jgi:hypothetical protein
MGIITRQVGSNAKGSSLTYAEMDNNLIYLDGKVTGSSGYIAVFSGSNAVSKSLIYQAGSQVGISTTSPIGNAALTTYGEISIQSDDSLRAFTVFNNNNDSYYFQITTDGTTYASTEISGSLSVSENISSSAILTSDLIADNSITSSAAKINTILTAATASVSNNLTVTGSIINNSIVSCSISASGGNLGRLFTVSLTKTDGSALTNKRQLIHWWTSTTQYGAATNIATQTYTTPSGSNLVPSSSGSINHAVTDTNGRFTLLLYNELTGGDTFYWLNTEVQGIVASTSGSVYTT